MLGHLVYILLVAAVVLSVPSPTADADVRAVLVVIGHRALALFLGAGAPRP